MTTAPMASDGLHIYTLVFYREGNSTSTKKATYCEVYSLEANVIKFVKEVKLLDEGNKPWVGSLRKNDQYGEGGYFDSGMLAVRGSYLVWISKRNFHIFNLNSGKREKRANYKDNPSWITCYDPYSCQFYSGDAAVYSFHDKWQIKGFEKIPLIKKQKKEDNDDVNLPEAPAVLDKAKNMIRKNIVKTKDPSYKLNLFPQLFGG